MYIEIEGCPDVHFIPFIEKSIEYYAEKLIPDKRTRNSITINVVFDDDLDALAYCQIADYNSRKRPNRFIIELHKNLGSRRILDSLAHEMVHVKQYVFGELDDNQMQWKGKKCDGNKIDYYERPWEFEANGKEEGLFTGLVVKYKLWNIFSDLLNPDDPVDYRPIAWKTDERKIC